MMDAEQVAIAAPGWLQNPSPMEWRLLQHGYSQGYLCGRLTVLMAADEPGCSADARRVLLMLADVMHELAIKVLGTLSAEAIH